MKKEWIRHLFSFFRLKHREFLTKDELERLQSSRLMVDATGCWDAMLQSNQIYREILAAHGYTLDTHRVRWKTGEIVPV